ncbi:Multicopper oxidase with three cupredoxin domains [Geosmithia morbida]|uniref:laccase n=1 Tax=Geosmithia morbida TaxID=1094350 RepID=A0A9P4YQK1_9HYPO|nr:Multicopper oxidase with three cupredoxin domains [Geosmithia morbida]KAF4121298.1 Multicopper oxidase with three cupredoxin domains [Geosmithia morbida]
MKKSLSFSLMALCQAMAVLASPSFMSLGSEKRATTCSGNTASTRSQWCDYSIDTNYYNEVVDTGVTREYWFELTDVTVAPDGVSRTAMAVNGSIPGPTIFADWGDTVTVHVTNKLTTSNNGTSIHWHGIRQNYTNQYDGVSSITQCPIAPGESLDYTWKATQYGSTWYHSHFALQAWQGVFGGIIINGPATANYDEDLGIVLLTDWDHQTVDELWESAETNGPPTLDTGLINGTNVWTDEDGNTAGSRLNVTFTEGTSYRMRLVNGAVDTHFKFSIDNHTLQVIASDLVPIEPYNTTSLNLGMGQRYDIIVTADQADVADSFWMRAIPQSACSDNDNADDIRGIVYYGDSTATPSTTGHDYTDSCDDETANITPHVSETISDADWTKLSEATVGTNDEGLFRWYLNSTTMLVNWADPTLLSIVDGSTDWSSSEAIIELDTADKWVYFVVETTLAVPHPIHLHGHDFFVLAQGTGTYSSSTTLNTSNPPRRDTAMLPASGHLVMAWKTDNPGAWLMHCHIGWHTSEGFGVQFIERQSEILGITTDTYVQDVCTTWSEFQETYTIEQDDSGI